MLTRIFEMYGRFCATYSPQVIFMMTLCLTAFMLHSATGTRQSREGLSGITYCNHSRCNLATDYKAADIVLTIIRCLAIPLIYYHFRNLQRMGSKYILGIAGLFCVFSSVVYTTSVVNFGRSDIADLKDALFFFLLLIDLSKVATLAQCALNSRNKEEVEANIARGMSLLGPTITLDTLVETLLISIGSLSGVRRLEILCTIACLGVIVNYVVFLTFYPACLSFILIDTILEFENYWDSNLSDVEFVAIDEVKELEEINEEEDIYLKIAFGQQLKIFKFIYLLPLHLSRKNKNMDCLSADKIFIMQPLNEEDQKPNPVVERVKMIMIAGLFIVHANSRWSLKGEKNEYAAEITTTFTDSNMLNDSDHKSFGVEESLMNWLLLSADYIVSILALVILALVSLAFNFFEDRSDMVAKRLRFQREKREAIAEEKTESHHDGSVSPDNMNTTMNMSLRQRFGIPTLPTIQQPVFPLSGVGGGWIEADNDAYVEYTDREVQTDAIYHGVNESIGENDSSPKRSQIPRSVEDCLEIYKSELGANVLTDEEVIQLVNHKHIAAYQLEKAVGDMERGVGIRRLIVSAAGNFTEEMADLPYKNYDYNKILGSCCENVIGYVPVPVGIAGPLLIDGQLYHVPMATTEGCLVASTNRGSRALIKCGVTTRIVTDGMTRGPVVRFPNIVRASEAMSWMQQPENFEEMKRNFDQTSRFARLTKIHVLIASRHLFIRFAAETGDAMGMNMLSKGTEKSLQMVQTHFPDMEILSLSGNFCTDKKPAAVNWIQGRGKSVVCEAIVPADVVTNVLKTSVHALVDVNISKNMIGSAVAGSIGGFNAHAANIVTAIFIATGQDPAQNVGSSNCMTLMEPWGTEGKDLYVSCTMPSIEVGTVGGGTGLPAQSACLAMLGVKGPHVAEPGENAKKLARIVCATVLAGELSLMAALTAGHLVKSHLRHNRSSILVNSSMNTTHSGGNGDSGKLTVPSVLPSSQNLCPDFMQKS